VFATEATHSFTLTVTDSDGASASRSGSVLVDGTAPITSVTTTGTLGPGGIYTSSVQFSMSAVDTGGSGLFSIYYKRDGSNQIGYTDATKPIFLSEGIHSITYWAADRAGNLEAQRTTSFTIDVSPPTVKITNPEDLLDTGFALQVGGEVVDFTATATDAGSGIAMVKFYVDGVLVKVDTSAGPYSYAWDSSTASTGRHVLSVKAIDGIGRMAEESIDVVKVG
jgi:hypothetical protein